MLLPKCATDCGVALEVKISISINTSSLGAQPHLPQLLNFCLTRTDAVSATGGTAAWSTKTTRLDISIRSRCNPPARGMHGAVEAGRGRRAWSLSVTGA